MGTKRPFTKVEASMATGRNNGGGDAGGEGHPWKKSRPSTTHTSRHRNSTPRPGGNSRSGGHDAATGWSKKRARTIERQLKHAGASALPANVRNDLERELASLKSTVDTATAKRQRSKMVSKYHMVRFFERQKATRLLKQLRKHLEATSDEKEKSRFMKEAHTTEVDIAYTTYYPHLEPYVSLYPSSETSPTSLASSWDRPGTDKARDESRNAAPKSSPASARTHLNSRRPELWYTIEGMMTQGQATLERLRDRRDSLESSRKFRPATKQEAHEESGNATESDKHHHHRDVSDGDSEGFFE